MMPSFLSMSENAVLCERDIDKRVHSHNKKYLDLDLYRPQTESTKHRPCVALHFCLLFAGGLSLAFVYHFNPLMRHVCCRAEHSSECVADINLSASLMTAIG